MIEDMVARAMDADDDRGKELRRGLRFGVCACGHLQVEHPGPDLCGRCSCGEYREVGRVDEYGKEVGGR